MTTPAAGTIPVSDLNMECGYPWNRGAGLNDGAFHAMRGGNSSPIAMSQFYNKTNRNLVAGSWAPTRVGWAAGSGGSISVPTLAGMTLDSIFEATDTVQVQVTFTGFISPGAFSYFSYGPYTFGATPHILYEAAASRLFFGGKTSYLWAVPGGALLFSPGHSYYVFIH